MFAGSTWAFARFFWPILVTFSLFCWMAAATEAVGQEDLAPVLEARGSRAALLQQRFQLVLSLHNLSLHAASRRCQAGDWGACRLEEWRQWLTDLAGESEDEQLSRVNLFVNSAASIPDDRNWHRPDYWAIPEELFGRGGDCEDYVIAKYLSLRSLGFSAQRLRIVVLQDQNGEGPHAVLAVFAKDEIVVLDNLRGRILPWADVRSEYRLLYSLNESAIWVHDTLS